MKCLHIPSCDISMYNIRPDDTLKIEACDPKGHQLYGNKLAKATPSCQRRIEGEIKIL